MYSDCDNALGNRCGSLPWPSQLLQTESWNHPELLYEYHTAKDHPVVLRHRPYPEFLHVGSLRTELGFLVLEQCSTYLGNHFVGIVVLYWYMVRLPRDLRLAEQVAFLDFAVIRHWSWSSKMGTNLVGYFEHWSLPAMGTWTLSCIISYAVTIIMVVAWNTRCHPGCRHWNDLTCHADESARRIHLDRSTSVGLNCDYGGKSWRTK